MQITKKNNPKKKIKSNFYLSIVMLLLIGVGCKNNKKSEGTVNKVLNNTTDQNNPSAIDWEGTYFGLLPCASCPGINILITLNADSTYEKTVEYLESNDEPSTTKGDFSWDKVGRISIEGNSYLIEKNRLFYLDSNNKKNEGELAENYILTKTELEPPLDSNEGYTLQLFTGSDNKNYNIIFNTNPKTPTAFLETKGFNKILLQTQSWAKGAEYSGGNIKLTVQADQATLIIKDKTIYLKEKGVKTNQ